MKEWVTFPPFMVAAGFTLFIPQWFPVLLRKLPKINEFGNPSQDPAFPWVRRGMSQFRLPSIALPLSLQRGTLWPFPFLSLFFNVHIHTGCLPLVLPLTNDYFHFKVLSIHWLLKGTSCSASPLKPSFGITSGYTWIQGYNLSLSSLHGSV